MKTDDLVAFLARGAGPREPKRWLRRLALALAGGLAIAVLLIVYHWGVRPDIGVKLMPTLMKAGFSAAAAATVLPLVLRLLRPGARVRNRVIGVAAFAALCALATLAALWGMPAEQRWEAWLNNYFPWCLVWIPILAAPTAAGLIWLARGLAPTRLAAAGAAIGALAGSIAAMAYSMYCPVDSVAFVATWYALSIALCAAFGALIGAIFLRW